MVRREPWSVGRVMADQLCRHPYPQVSAVKYYKKPPLPMSRICQEPVFATDKRVELPDTVYISLRPLMQQPLAAQSRIPLCLPPTAASNHSTAPRECAHQPQNLGGSRDYGSPKTISGPPPPVFHQPTVSCEPSSEWMHNCCTKKLIRTSDAFQDSASQRPSPTACRRKILTRIRNPLFASTLATLESGSAALVDSLFSSCDQNSQYLT